MKLCPKCGKKVNVLYDDLCKECSAQTMELFSYNPKDVSMCRSCDTVHEGMKRYKDQSLKRSIETVIKNRIKISENLKSSHIEVDLIMPESPRKRDKIKTKATVYLKGSTEAKVRVEEEFEVPVTFRYILCEKCSKMNTQYYEGILQIRHPDKERIEEAINVLEKIMEGEGKRSVFVTDTMFVKGGVDAYVTSQKHIKDIGKKMFEIMGGEFKINEQLFSYNHLASKNLYRVNVLIRLPDFEAGSVILLGEKLIHVKKVKGNFVMGRDLLWNKDITLNYKDQETTLIAGKKDIFESTVVKMRPELEILNPISYESERVQNSKHLKAYKMGDKVHIFLYKKGVWIIE